MQPSHGFTSPPAVTAATLGTVDAYLDHGKLWIANSTILADVSLQSYKSASAYLLAVDVGDAGMLDTDMSSKDLAAMVRAPEQGWIFRPTEEPRRKVESAAVAPAIAAVPALASQATAAVLVAPRASPTWCLLRLCCEGHSGS